MKKFINMCNGALQHTGENCFSLRGNYTITGEYEQNMNKK